MNEQLKSLIDAKAFEMYEGYSGRSKKVILVEDVGKIIETYNKDKPNDNWVTQRDQGCY